MTSPGSPRAGRIRGRGRGRAGFTLVEVIFAIAMIGAVLLGFAVFTRNFVRASNSAALRASASDLAVQRVESAKSATSYAAIDALAGTEPTIANAPHFTRRTVVLHTSTSTVDYKTVTVTVTNSALATSVSKTTAIAAF